MQQNPLGGESLQGELRAIRVLADMGQKGQKADVCESHGLAEIPCKKFKDGSLSAAKRASPQRLRTGGRDSPCEQLGCSSSGAAAAGRGS